MVVSDGHSCFGDNKHVNIGRTYGHAVNGHLSTPIEWSAIVPEVGKIPPPPDPTPPSLPLALEVDVCNWQVGGSCGDEVVQKPEDRWRDHVWGGKRANKVNSSVGRFFICLDEAVAMVPYMYVRVWYNLGLSFNGASLRFVFCSCCTAHHDDFATCG